MRLCVQYNGSTPERPQRPNDMSLNDLKPGTRVLVYNDKLINSRQRLAKHEIVMSEPYKIETDDGKKFMAIKSRRVSNHLTDKIPIDSEEGVREIALSGWGITPNSEGQYSQTKFAEPFVGQTEPLQVKHRNNL